MNYADLKASIENGKTFSAPYIAADNGSNPQAGVYMLDFERCSVNGISGSLSGSDGVATALYESSAGAIPHGGNVSSDKKFLLSWGTHGMGSSAVDCVIFLVDLLLYYPNCIAHTSPTTLDNTVTLPRYTDGEGVMLGMFAGPNSVSSSSGYTINYRNTGNTARSATVDPFSVGGYSSSSNGLFVPLQSGDTGVLRIDSYTLNPADSPTNAFDLVLFKPIARHRVVFNRHHERTFLVPPFLPKIEDGACLTFITMHTANNVTSHYGNLSFGWSP